MVRRLDELHAGLDRRERARERAAHQRMIVGDGDPESGCGRDGIHD